MTEEFKSGSNTVKSLEEEDRKVKADIITENEDKTPKKAANLSNNSGKKVYIIERVICIKNYKIENIRKQIFIKV